MPVLPVPVLLAVAMSMTTVPVFLLLSVGHLDNSWFFGRLQQSSSFEGVDVGANSVRRDQVVRVNPRSAFADRLQNTCD